MANEYLLKSGVMAELEAFGYENHPLSRVINKQPTYTFPDPSLAVDVKPANYPEIPDGSLKLEAGKLYRTRDGRKAFVSIVKSDCNCVHGMVEEYYESITWCLDGRHYSDGKTAHIDLISLWDEPTPESGNSKLLAELDEWIILGEQAVLYSNFDSAVVKLAKLVREIARLLAERGG